jgi:hypothetical protein
MKRLLFALWFAVGGSVAQAAPLFVTESVSMGEAGTLDVEFRPIHRSDERDTSTSETIAGITTTTETEIEDTVQRHDLNVRWVPMDRWEASMEVPFLDADRDIKVKTTNSFIGTTTMESEDSESGLGQIVLGTKYAFLPMLGGALRLELPNADTDKGLGEGFNVGALLLAEHDMGPVKVYGNMGYMIKGEYESDDDDDSSTPDVETDPGDLIQANAAVSHERWGMTWVGELNLNIFGKDEEDGVEVQDTDGTSLDLVLGGHKIFENNFSLKAGVALGLLDDEERSVDLVRGAGDYKITLAAGYRFGGR